MNYLRTKGESELNLSAPQAISVSVTALHMTWITRSRFVTTPGDRGDVRGPQLFRLQGWHMVVNASECLESI